MKKKLLFMFAFLCSVGMWADTYTITLKDNGTSSDGSSKIANAGSAIDAAKYSVSAANFVDNIKAANAYVFQARSDCGWKFGNSNNGGKITINLKNAVEISSVKVTAKNATNKVADIKIGGGSAKALTSDFAEYTQTYTSGNSTSSIDIESALHTSADRRAYITSIVITTAGSGGNTPQPTTLAVPTNLSSSNVTTTSATLSWGTVSNASSYTVKIGETEYTGVNTNSYSATGLTAGTQYTWTVKAVGDGTNYTTSAYAANANFTTETEQGGGDDPQLATLPHTATFNGSTQTYTTGWTTTATGLSRADCVVVGKDENLTSPAFDLSSFETVTVTFKGRKFGSISNSKAVVDLSIGGVSQGTIDFTATSVGDVSGNITFTPTQSMTNAVLVFTCTNATSAGSSHGAGFGSITITGKVPSTDPYFEDIETVKIAQDATSGEFAYVLGNPDGSTLVAAEKEDVAWISNVAVDEVNKKVTFDVTPNTGAAREAIITLTYGELVKDVTISQAKLVLDYATLPFNITSGTTGTELKQMNGITCKIDGSDYNNDTHKIKLSSNSHYVQVKTNERIGVCSFSFKGCANAGSSSFKLQESENGTEWADVESFTVTFSAKDEVKDWTSTNAFSADARYVKLAFQKTTGEVNCGLGESSIAKYVPTSATINITNARYATYVATIDLDFSEADVIAYAVTPDVANDRVTLSPVTTVPAGKAIVVKGTAGEHEVPAAASADDFQTALEVSATAITAEEGDEYTYYYLGKEGDAVGFRPLNVDGTLAAGKCFFKVEKASGAKFLSFSFDDVTTGINNIENVKNNNVVYNLAGQRVTANAKGIVIVNGKKMLNK